MTDYCAAAGRSVAFSCVLAVGALILGLGEASAQFPPVPGSQASPFPPPGGQAGPPRGASPFPAPGAPLGGGGSNVCDNFMPIRTDAERSAAAIKAAGERKAMREEVCPLFRDFAAKEGRMLKFLVTNQSACGIPPQAIDIAKKNHSKTLEIRKVVCAAGPAGPAGPSLSDALGGPIAAAPEEKKTGLGTFETLTGNALAR